MSCNPFFLSLDAMPCTATSGQRSSEMEHTSRRAHEKKNGHIVNCDRRRVDCLISLFTFKCYLLSKMSNKHLNFMWHWRPPSDCTDTAYQFTHTFRLSVSIDERRATGDERAIWYEMWRSAGNAEGTKKDANGTQREMEWGNCDRVRPALSIIYISSV